MRIKGNYLLVKVIEEEKKSSGGVILPDTTQKDGTLGEVVEVGEGTLFESHVINEEGMIVHKMVKQPIDEALKPGVKVIYPRWAGYEVEIDEEKYLMVREHDILATVE